jgi:hypothetical protein
LSNENKILIIGSCIEITILLNNILAYGFDVLFYDCSGKGYLSEFAILE